MRTAIRIGRMRENNNLSIHLSVDGRTCRSDINIAADLRTGYTPGMKLCKRCFTPKRIALAATVNNASPTFTAYADKFLSAVGPQSTLNPAGYNVEHDEERAEIAAQHAAFWAEPEAVATPLSKFGQAAANAGYAAGKPKRTVTRRSANSRAKFHNSFRTTVKAA